MLYFAFFYGLMTVIGGLIGYFKAGSMASLISGGASGLLILASAFILLKGSPMGYYGVVALAVLLGGWFGMKFFNSYAFMPAGLMLALSVITLVGFIIQRPSLLHTP